jgi:hypothetical protein
MTVSSTLEAKLRGRQFSTAPAEAAAKVLGIKEFRSEAAKSRFSNLVHWGYGTGWGAGDRRRRTGPRIHPPSQLAHLLPGRHHSPDSFERRRVVAGRIMAVDGWCFGELAPGPGPHGADE